MDELPEKKNKQLESIDPQRDLLIEIFEDNVAAGCHAIANYLIDYFHIKTIGEREREVFIYEDGVYVPGINPIRKWIQGLLGERCKTHTKNEILEKVKDMSGCDRKEFMRADKDLINLNNGVFNLKTRALLPSSPDFLFLNKIPVAYTEDADCPKFKQFLEEILDADAIKIIQEVLGFGLYRSYFIKKAIILVGEQNTGKTTLLRIMSRFFGEDNIAGISLQKISSDKFAAAHLYNKHVNIHDDLSFRDINDNGAFKIVTGGGYVTGEYKFGNQFQFENYAKLIFACNKIPDVKDADDEAYFGRWIVIRFNREIEKVNKFLVEEVSTAKEMSGVLNFALEGLSRLLAEQKFSYDKSPEEIQAEMMREGSSATSFIATCVAYEPDAWTSKDDMYMAFRAYAIENNLTILNKAHLGRKIVRYALRVRDGKKRDVTGWYNAKLTAYQPVSHLEPLDDPAATAPDPEGESRLF